LRDSSVWWRMFSGIRSGVGWGCGVGLRIMSVGWLVEGVWLIFGWIIGWGEHLYECNFPAYLIWLKTKGWQWGRWKGEGGWMEVVSGNGGGAFWLGKRRQLQSVRRCYVILFCIILFLTGGGGFLILSTVTSLRGLISILRCLSHLWSAAFWCNMVEASFVKGFCICLATSSQQTSNQRQSSS